MTTPPPPPGEWHCASPACRSLAASPPYGRAREQVSP